MPSFPSLVDEGHATTGTDLISLCLNFSIPFLLLSDPVLLTVCSFSLPLLSMLLPSHKIQGFLNSRDLLPMTPLTRISPLSVHTACPRHSQRDRLLWTPLLHTITCKTLQFNYKI